MLLLALVPGRRDVSVWSLEHDERPAAGREHFPLRIGLRQMAAQRALLTRGGVEQQRNRIRHRLAFGIDRNDQPEGVRPDQSMQHVETFFLEKRRLIHV